MLTFFHFKRGLESDRVQNLELYLESNATDKVKIKREDKDTDQLSWLLQSPLHF